MKCLGHLFLALCLCGKFRLKHIDVCEEAVNGELCIGRKSQDSFPNG